MSNLKDFANSKLQRLFIQPDQAIAIHRDRAFILTPPQNHYLYQVLRSQPQTLLIALDGKGSWWLAQLPQLQNQPVTILESQPPTLRANAEVTLAIAMPKGNGMESIIKQATEIGVDKIVTLWSDRTQLKAGTELGKQKIERWHRIAQEAAELACSAHVPQIYLPQNLSQWLTESAIENQVSDRYICVTTPNQPHLYSLLPQARAAKIALLIGAEGGWSESETTLAIAHNWQPVSLGNQILSALTAPVVGLSLVNSALENRN